MNDKFKPSSIWRIMRKANGSYRKRLSWLIIGRQMWRSICSFRLWRGIWSSNISISSRRHRHSPYSSRRHANFNLNPRWFWRWSSASSPRPRQCTGCLLANVSYTVVRRNASETPSWRTLRWSFNISFWSSSRDCGSFFSFLSRDHRSFSSLLVNSTNTSRRSRTVSKQENPNTSSILPSFIARAFFCLLFHLHRRRDLCKRSNIFCSARWWRWRWKRMSFQLVLVNKNLFVSLFYAMELYLWRGVQTLELHRWSLIEWRLIDPQDELPLSSTRNVRGEMILVLGNDRYQRCVDTVTQLLSKIMNQHDKSSFNTIEPEIVLQSLLFNVYLISQKMFSSKKGNVSIVFNWRRIWIVRSSRINLPL